MANRLLSRLREKDKKGLFKPTQTSISYLTGFTPLDYKNGYIVEVRDRNEKLIQSYNALGIVGGTFITIVGKTGTAKTTLAIQIASNIVRNFDDDVFIVHYDLEQALNWTRIKKVSGLSHAELEDKYVLKQEKCYIEDIFEAIQELAIEKETNKEDYLYDTGLMDEFNQPIIAYKPTVVILDSIPTVSTKEGKDVSAEKQREKEKEMEGGTYANRVAKALAQFFKKLMPIIKPYNITVISINHINAKIEINSFAKTQPQILTMKMDESLPGGNACIYYANNIFKLTSIGSEKYTVEKNGFDGFLSRVDLLKSRTNKSGQFCELVYNQVCGFDPILSQLNFATTNGLVEGRNPYRYFKSNKDLKFNSNDFKTQWEANPELRKALFESSIPLMEQQLKVGCEETNSLNSYVEAIKALSASQEGEEFKEETITIDADPVGIYGGYHSTWDFSHLDYMIDVNSIKKGVH